jgi:hypothetical protein
MAGVDALRTHAEEFTAVTGIATEVAEGGLQLFVTLKQVQPPAGLFAVTVTDVLFITDPMYPMSAMDMFWTDIGLTRPDGRIPQGASAVESYIGRQWRRFSWHRNGIWNPTRNGVLDHFAFVEAGWAQEAKS